MKWPKAYFHLLFGLGISNLGSWIYLIALNLYIWNLTHSPAAIALLYVISPTVQIISNFFVGSFIDRWNKKKIVVSVDLIRGFIVFLIPFADELWVIYLLVACTNIAGTFFSPSSTYLITTLVNDSHKLRFNSIHSMLNSGAFMIGPAIAGAILMFATTDWAIWVNAVTFVLCAISLAQLPNERSNTEEKTQRITFKILREDWKITRLYAKTIKNISLFLIFYSVALMIAYSLDSQEMAFLLEHLHISEELYGLTVGITGVGAIIGGSLAAYLAPKIAPTIYLKIGFLFTLICYLSFYASNQYSIAVIFFILLGFFMAFSNSGYATIFQTAVDPKIMGRFSSMLSLIQGVLQVIFTLVIGYVSQIFSIQFATVIFASIAVIFGVFICFIQLKKEASKVIN